MNKSLIIIDWLNGTISSDELKVYCKLAPETLKAIKIELTQ